MGDSVSITKTFHRSAAVQSIASLSHRARAYAESHNGDKTHLILREIHSNIDSPIEQFVNSNIVFGVTGLVCRIFFSGRRRKSRRYIFSAGFVCFCFLPIQFDQYAQARSIAK